MRARMMRLRRSRSSAGLLVIAIVYVMVMIIFTGDRGNPRHQRSRLSRWSITGQVGDKDKYASVSSVNALIIKNCCKGVTGKNISSRKEVASDEAIILRVGREGTSSRSEQVRTSWSFAKVGKYLSEPVDPHNYKYIHNPVNVCKNSKGENVRVSLVIFVISALENVRRRDHIRVTYGNSETWEYSNQTLARTVFMLGSTSDTTLQAKIDDEARIYGDVVQEDFVDSYLNLTRKTVMGFKWVTRHCRHAKFAMKIDDDSMMNKGRILEFLASAPDKGVVIGNVNLNMPVIRSKKGEWGKYHISEEFFPASRYPPYLSGPAYIMSTDVMEATYRTAVTTIPLFPLEDVFVGLCLRRMGVSLMHDDRFLCSLVSRECYRDDEWLTRAVFIDLNMETMVRVWVESSLYADKLLEKNGFWKM